MREDATGTLVDDFKRADHTDGVALISHLVDEGQPIQAVGLCWVLNENSRCLPTCDLVCRVTVGIGIRSLDGHVDMHHVVSVESGIARTFRLADDVVRWSGQGRESIVSRVSSRTKRFKARHNYSVPLPPVLCDIDGVVWLLHEPIDGSVEAVARLREAGHRVIFVTNNSYSTVGDQEAALAKIGISADGDVVTSSQAAGSLLKPGERVLLGGGPGVSEAIERNGARVVGRSDSGEEVDFSDIDTVIVGYHSTFDYRGLTLLSGAVRHGARLIATNDDATYPTPKGLIPGGGSLLAAVVAAAGVAPIIAGKPHEAMANLVREVSGTPDLARAWMIGDRSSTDGLFARRVGCRFAHVMSGVVRESRPEDGAAVVAANLSEAVDHILRNPS